MMKGKDFFAKAPLTLFAVLFSVTGARAQQAIPYEYGFENNDLAAEGWTTQGVTSSNTGISTNAANSGSRGFRINYSEKDAYLVSPVFTGTDKEIKVSFFYKEASNQYGDEQFQVGYTTDETVTDASAFTYGDVVTASTSWQEYSEVFPAGTKRIAVKYIYNDTYYLYLDDFIFTAFEGIVPPTGLKVSYDGGTEATVSWSSDYNLFDIDVNGTVIENVENPYTLTSLAYETEYIVKVRAKKDDATSDWSKPVSFTTEVQFPAPTDVAASDVTAFTANISWNGTADSYNLRYRSVAEGAVIFSDSFEEGLSQWTIVRNGEGNDNTDWRQFDGNFSSSKIPGHSGEYMVMSRSWSGSAYNVDNWMISPLVELGGILKFWVMDDGSYHEHYDIYVSTSTNDISAFTKVYEPGEATSDWTEVTVNLSKFAGQQGYFAFRHTDADQDYLLIDDVTLLTAAVATEWTLVNGATSPYSIEGLDPDTNYDVQVQAVYADGESAWVGTNFTTAEEVATPSALAASDVTKNSAVLAWTENGEATAWEICLNDDEANLISADSNPFTLKGLTPTTDYTAKVRAVNGEKQSHWSKAVSFTTDIAFPAPAELAASNISSTSASISWTADATATGAELEYAEGNVFGSELRYDNGTFATNIGSSSEGTWTWGAMYPGSMVSASQLTKMSIYETTYNTGDITINVYQGGDTAPGTLLYTETVTTEHANAFQDVTFASPVAITPGENLWITLTETGTYVMAACQTSESNNQWVLDESWSNIGDLASSLAAYGWMIRASISDDIDPSSVKWTAVADATSPYELTGLKPETTYTVRVKSIFGEEGESEWTSTAFTTAEDNPVPSNVEADLAADGTTLTWDGNGDSYNVRYRTASTKETEFEANFDAGLDEWTIVTAGEGPGWIITDEVGINAATAYSWKDNVSYNADNWLISPAVELGGTVTFSVTTATSYPDSYEVLLSTTGTDISDFTTTLQAMAAATPGEVTIDLSEYSGTGHIAIHHVSSDCYLLVIYEFAIYGKEVPSGEWTEMAVNDATATLSGLATNNAYEYQVQSVKDGSATDWTEAAQFALLTLDNNSDNKGNIQKFHDMVAHVTLADRTIYTDGTWNTITLPFNLTPEQLAASPLAGADVRTLTSALTVSEESVTLNFTEEGAIETAWGQYYGGVPYIFKIDGTGTISNPEFAGVTIAKTLNPMTGSDATSGISITFEPTYAPINFTSDDTSILFVGADNKLVYPLAGASIGACRGYFDLTGVSAGEASGVKILTNLDDEDATGIAGISNVKESGEWYDLSGRKLAGKPAVKGIYVTEGRKVTVK